MVGPNRAQVSALQLGVVHRTSEQCFSAGSGRGRKMSFGASGQNNAADTEQMGQHHQPCGVLAKRPELGELSFLSQIVALLQLFSQCSSRHE